MPMLMLHNSLSLHVPGNGIPSGGGWWFMVFNVTFNNISVISWWSVLLVEET
jgi:hypothetical protein